MAETDTRVNPAEGSPQHVAYRLMECIAHAEGMSLNGRQEDAPDREWILSTYAQCLQTVLHPRNSN